MTEFLVVVTIFVGVVIVVGLHRVVRGPTVFDRIVASALVTANGVVLLLLIGFLFERVGLFVDIAIAYGLLAFLLPVAIGKYFNREGGP